MKTTTIAGLCALGLTLAACAQKPYVAPPPNKFDGRYIGTFRTVYPKCTANQDSVALLVKDNLIMVRVDASSDRVRIDADGAITGNASMMSATGTIAGTHLSMELVGTECFYRFELDRR